MWTGVPTASAIPVTIDAVGQRDTRRQSIERDRDLARVLRVGIGCNPVERAGRAAFQIGPRGRIAWKNAVLGAHLDGKIAQHQAVVDLERFSRELQRLIVGAVGT
jgi:hypothetical protein